MTTSEANCADQTLEGGSYEVIRRRLLEQTAELGRRADNLNERRKQLFGGGELALTETARVRTINNCVPRDVVSVDGHLLFAFNVFLGLKSETTIADVLSLLKFSKTDSGVELTAAQDDAGAAFLRDAEFEKQLRDVFRYNKEARILQLRRTDTRLLIVVQIGATLRDCTVFRFAIDARGTVTFMDARGEEDCAAPQAHPFVWTPTTRDDQVPGAHPHLNILNELFVETVDGDLTIKIENNTSTGSGIYREPVDDKNQTLDDADISYAKVGRLILLRVKPFREEHVRYLVYNTRTEQVLRIDALGQACVELPEDHGIVFPGGYYLQTGESRLFDDDVAGLTYARTILSPNGEDVLYVFYRHGEGTYELLPYNLVKKDVATPIRCSGYSLGNDGTMVVFRTPPAAEPTRVHPVQVWKTPFVTAEFAASAPKDGSYLSKVGNADLVSVISDVMSMCRLAGKEQPNRRTFEDVIAGVARLLGSHYWLGHAEAEGLQDALKTVQLTTELVVGEFEKAQQIAQRAAESLAEAERIQQDVLVRLQLSELRSADAYLSALTELRGHRGKLIGLKEVRGMEVARVDNLEASLLARFDEVSRACVDFFLKDSAFAPLLARLDRLVQSVEKVDKSVALQPLHVELTAIQEGLSLLTETVTSLKIDDATSRTRILDGASTAFSQQNRARAIVEGKRRALIATEGRAEFSVQFKLLGQSVTSALGLATTPEACDQQLARLMLQFEELEGRFGMLDEFALELTSKREEVLDAVTSRRQVLLEERQRRARHLVSTAERIMAGILRRAKALRSLEELNGYFASDPMVGKLGELRDKLRELEENTHADEIEAKLSSAKQTAQRLLRDKTELFEGDENVIRLGAHRFSVTELALDLSVVPREEQLCFHLTGTDYYEAIEDEQLNEAKEFWSQELVSETPDIYRAEYLAVSLLREAEAGGRRGGGELQSAIVAGKLSEFVRAAAMERLDEGYEPGVHDHDACLLLERLTTVLKTVGVLRFSPNARALGWLFWNAMAADRRDLLERRAQSAGRLASRLSDRRGQLQLAREIAPQLVALGESLRLEAMAQALNHAAQALVEELAQPRVCFSTSHRASELERRLLANLEECGARREFEEDLRMLEAHLPERLATVLNYLDSWFENDSSAKEFLPYRFEAAVRLCLGQSLPLQQVTTDTQVTVTGLLGTHPRLQGQTFPWSIDLALETVQSYLESKAPKYREYRLLRLRLAAEKREQLRLDEFIPKVLTSFVRNRLIDEVYLALVGANLAKQVGAAGSAKRTDLMGLLLLVSPPGYGKTTLMEYVASRLGLIFMKVNGPALGTEVRSLDPAEASNATARQEVEKINLALEMGNNVMLYLDDIQHTHPELLQKFISLCDGQRRIEGVWRGRTRTYDLRGKRFCIVMAGNPYTESGARFQIPDMLANRADTYNLGDILEGREEAFALSYLENALTSNRTLATLAGRDAGDVYKLISRAQGRASEECALAHDYSPAESEEYVSLFRGLLQIQRVLLKVNLEYIASASKDDKYRTEPPFKLQGSYRNMNKLAEKLVSSMNEAEIERLIDAHYAGESQTLTSAAEQNLLKLGELRGRLSEAQSKRWHDIKEGYQRVQRMGGKEDDPVSRMTGSISGLDVQLGGIREALGLAIEQFRKDARATDTSVVPGWLEPVKAALGELSRQKIEVALSNPAPSELMAMLGEHLNHLGASLARAMSSRGTVPPPNVSGADARLDGLVAAVDNLSQLVAEAQNAIWREEVEVSLPSNSNFYHTLAGNNVVDDGGVFVATWSKPPALGTIAELGLTDQKGQRMIVRGIVAFAKDDLGSDSPSGYGVRFLRVGDKARAFVEACVRQRAPLVY